MLSEDDGVQNCPDETLRHPSRFVMSLVKLDNSSVPLEVRYGGEINAMLGEVRASLGFTPLILHASSVSQARVLLKYYIFICIPACSRPCLFSGSIPLAAASPPLLVYLPLCPELRPPPGCQGVSSSRVALLGQRPPAILLAVPPTPTQDRPGRSRGCRVALRLRRVICTGSPPSSSGPSFFMREGIHG